eukprot:scaffold491686_cov25-Prasinocladus_malaysianus.AAC.1
MSVRHRPPGCLSQKGVKRDAPAGNTYGNDYGTGMVPVISRSVEPRTRRGFNSSSYRYDTRL